MAEDNKPVVPVEPAPPVEPVSTPTTPVVEPTPLTTEQEAKVTQMIADATAKAVTEAKDLGKRELQSSQDKNRAEVAKAERRARLAEGTLGATHTQLQTLDPEAAKEMELAQLRAEKAGRLTLDQEATLAQQQEVQGKALQDSLTAHLAALGIDPNDKRIDWAGDSANYVQGRSRFDVSVAQIVKEDKQTMQTGLEKRLKDLETKMTASGIEANSVSTAASPGVVAGSDAEFMKKFGAGELPTSKENLERVAKIQNSY